MAGYKIFELELAAALIGVIVALQEFKGDIILLNIDNQAAMHSLIRGNSKQDTAAKLCQATWFAPTTLKTSSAPISWLEYVPSHLNIADRPSRICYEGCKEWEPFPQTRRESVEMNDYFKTISDSKILKVKVPDVAKTLLASEHALSLAARGNIPFRGERKETHPETAPS